MSLVSATESGIPAAHVVAIWFSHLGIATVLSGPTNVGAVPLSPSSIEISWSPPDDDGGKNIYPLSICKYDNLLLKTGSEVINYFLGLLDTSNGLEFGAVAGPDARTFIHTGLSPATTYMWAHPQSITCRDSICSVVWVWLQPMSLVMVPQWMWKSQLHQVRMHTQIISFSSFEHELALVYIEIHYLV